ncbi:MAG: xerC [Devosia sp.]|uniref:tyrosine-type recombinase/integrase n=1 Tax=Devosia sp. TaxID=1871048 RepID=UPI002604133F|nr:site-specific integrase [Devosia sp.]MDB5540552.1 xerC [Devosia sp.]
MPPPRRHPQNALSAMRVQQLKTAGRYTDGNGLYLVVDPSGAKRWLLRTVVMGRRRDIGLGGLSLVSLAEARALATEYRKIAREGGDPLSVRRSQRVVVPTFSEAAEAAHGALKEGFRNAKHADQWINTIKQYAYPQIGSRRIDDIGTPDILKVLAPLWLKKSETARRLKQRMHKVFEHAKASGLRSGENPVAGVDSGLPKQMAIQEHHAALPFAELPDFLVKLRSEGEHTSSRLALELLILTATRTSEVLLTRWEEFDIESAIWTIPPERMKVKRVHRVPLTARCLEILAAAKKLAAGSGFVFPGMKVERPLSNMVFLKLLERMKVDVTAHGFRSTFSDWAAERTQYSREVVEMALAHTIKSKVEAAYRRGDLLDKRRPLMADWSKFCLSSVQSFGGEADEPTPQRD